MSNKGRSTAGHIHFSTPLLQSRKIRQIAEARIVGRACIRPSLGEYYDISYNPKLSIPALRFAIAHEIGHTYWFRPGGGAKPLSPLQRTLGRDPDIEYLCNWFADALLFPLDVVRASRSHFESTKALPLDLIPTLGAKLRVNEKTVVRRLFFRSEMMLTALVCLRSTENEHWKTQWCALSNNSYEDHVASGFKIPLLSKRVIPQQMIPDVSEGQCEAFDLDGRWWAGIKQVPLAIARIPFAQIPQGTPRKGFAHRMNDRIYIALP